MVTLDEFVDETIKQASAKGYVPTTFMNMRQKYGTVQAIKRLVETSEPQSGFRRLQTMGMKVWTLEAAVVKFPGDFPDPKTQAYAQSRLSGLFDK